MKKRLWIAAVVVAIVAAVTPGVASAGSPSCDRRVNNNINKLLECVTVEGVRQHQAAFQAAADASGGTRAAGFAGYDASVAYVTETLEAAGYDVELDPFEFTFVPPATLNQTAPIAASYETGAFTGTGFGTVDRPGDSGRSRPRSAPGLDQRL